MTLEEVIVEHLRYPVYQFICLIGALIVFYGLVSLFVKEKMYLTESLIATIIGIICGPSVLGLINLEHWFDTKEKSKFQRVLIAIQVMAVAVSLPRSYIISHKRSFLMFLLPIMLVMWVVSSIIVKLALSFSWTHSFIVGACVTPTDPILAHSVIKGKFANKYIPHHLRNIISAESGANDGLGFPLLMLPIYFLQTDNIGKALMQWLTITWLYEIGLSIVIGFILGYSAKHILQKSEKNGLIDKGSFLAFSIGLAVII
ncbi:hypothetical protein ROZALSC1DRAFT_12335, partial [Rozella allomycis CSF55]